MKKIRILHQDRVQNIFQCHDNNIKNRCALKIYVIVLIPIFDTTYKAKNRSKCTCELYITNWYYYYKLGIVFALFQRMLSKGASWDVPRPWQQVLASVISCDRSRFLISGSFCPKLHPYFAELGLNHTYYIVTTLFSLGTYNWQMY